MVSAYASSAAAQSVKDVIGDKTGKYIYAQAYDTSAEEAYNLASAELDSRVEAYLGEHRPGARGAEKLSATSETGCRQG